jgi:DNA-binding response OmpR family regulator
MKLFERFYQVKNDGRKTGFGIGLYLVKKFIEAHEGSISYKSAEGRGTAFTITLNKGSAVPGPTWVEDNTMVAENTANSNPVEKVHLAQKAELTPFDGETEDLDHHNGVSTILNELNEEMPDEPILAEQDISQELTTDKQTLLVIDDDNEIRNYLLSVFQAKYKIYEADSAEDGIKLAHKHLPDLIISDILMKGINGLDLCRTLKGDATVSHIPIILLTGTTSDEMQLKGMESGADDFIKKPFDKDILQARVSSILKRRNILQSYFYNEITFGSGKYKVSEEYKVFLHDCMQIIEDHLTDEQFSIKVLATSIGMSHSNLYRKIKAISGQSVRDFIRFIRLRKAAEIFINSESNVNETALRVGFHDMKYFRGQFMKLYGLNPSEYIKKYRKPFHSTHHVEGKMVK